MADSFLGVKVVSRVFDGAEVEKGLVWTRVVSRVLDGVVVVGGGQVQGEFGVLQVMFQLNAAELYIIARNAKVQVGWCAPRFGGHVSETAEG